MALSRQNSTSCEDADPPAAVGFSGGVLAAGRRITGCTCAGGGPAGSAGRIPRGVDERCAELGERCLEVAVLHRIHHFAGQAKLGKARSSWPECRSTHVGLDLVPGVAVTSTISALASKFHVVPVTIVPCVEVNVHDGRWPEGRVDHCAIGYRSVPI